MTTPYSLIPITIIVVFFYSLTFILTKIHFIRTSVHRKIWNVVLLITFLVSGMLGVLLTVQINYKLDIPYLDDIMVLHVEFGIGMALVSGFHILWHIKYFKQIIAPKQKHNIPITTADDDMARLKIEEDSKNIKIGNRLTFTVIALGATSLITQIVLLREFLSVFYGNELIIGIVLTNWMLITGVGAYLGRSSLRRKHKIGAIILMQLLLAVLPFITVFLLNILRNLVFNVGEMIDILHILYASFILLIPFCLISGFTFTLLCHVISAYYKTNLIGKVYSFEAVGSIAGGLLFNLILIYLFDSFQILVFLMMINFTSAFLLSFKLKKLITKIIIAALACILLIPPLFIDFGTLAKEILYNDQKVIYHNDTPYGSLMITEDNGQRNFFENGVFLFSTNTKDVTTIEEPVHFAMIQHPNPKSVLLISGGVAGMTNEILKYNVDRIDYVEINPEIIRIGRKYTSALENQRIRIITQDPRLYINRNPSNAYDVALINTPEPSTSGLNRYYTVEFFTELKAVLQKDAIVSIAVTASANYMSEESVSLNSVLYHTLKQVFNNVTIIPGTKNYFLASDKKLTANIVQQLDEKNIDSEYVRYYLDDMQLSMRSNEIMELLKESDKTNTDFNPIAYYRQLKYWLSHFRFNYWILGGILLLCVVFMFSRLHLINIGMFTGGFAASSIQILLIISFQVIYGYVFQMVGIIITVFMIGLAAGAMYLYRMMNGITVRNYIRIQYFIAVYSILLPLLLYFLSSIHIHELIVYIVFFFLSFTIACLVGIEFTIASKLQRRQVAHIAAEIYGADLFGSALGALLVAAFLIPLFGISTVSFIVAALNIVSGTLVYIKRKKIHGV